jgi:hypothetical protein
MNKIPMLEKFAAQSLVEHDGELIFSKEKFAELIVRECMDIAYAYDAPKLSGPGMIVANRIEDHFGVEE